MDNFHELETIMLPVGLYDVLEITKSDVFEFIASGKSIDVSPKENLCVKAFQLMQKRYETSNVRIHLRKQIPMGGGMGGGSSDATFVIRGLNKLFELQLSDKTMQELAAEIGSDCAFFVKDETQLATGRGEVLENVSLQMDKSYLKIIFPNIHISTKEAFSNVHISGDKGELEKQIQLPISEWKHCIKNDFEQHIFEAHPTLQKIKEKLYADGALYASMSGSGSTLYGVFDYPPKVNSTELWKELLVPLVF